MEILLQGMLKVLQRCQNLKNNKDKCMMLSNIKESLKNLMKTYKKNMKQLDKDQKSQILLINGKISFLVKLLKNLKKQESQSLKHLKSLIKIILVYQVEEKQLMYYWHYKLIYLVKKLISYSIPLIQIEVVIFH